MAARSAELEAAGEEVVMVGTKTEEAVPCLLLMRLLLMRPCLLLMRLASTGWLLASAAWRLASATRLLVSAR